MKRRQDGRWCRKFTLPNGRAKYFYSSAKSEREAIKDIENQLLTYNEENNTDNIKFCKVADEWNTEYRERIPEINYNKNTRNKYNNVVEHFGNRKISQISAIDINIYISSIISQHYSKKTVAGYKSLLKMIFNYAILHGYIKSNPVDAIRLPSGLPQTERKIPENEVLKIVSEHYEGFDLFPFFLLYTGMRKSEALAVKGEDIDFKNSVIHVRNHVIHNINQPVFEPVLKTKSAKRDIILLDKLAGVLPKKCEGFLFSMDNDGKAPLTKNVYDRRWDNYCKKYGITLTAHQLRHGYATMLYESGVDEKVAQFLMGHADIKLTHDIYTHIRDVKLSQTANKLNSFSF